MKNKMGEPDLSSEYYSIGRYLLEIRRIISVPLQIAYFNYKGLDWDPSWRIYGLPSIHRYKNSKISLGKDLDIRSWRKSNPLTPNHPVVISTRTAEAEISIGEGSGLTGSTLVSASQIRIGANVAVGSNATIIDLDFHPINYRERMDNVKGTETKPVLIGNGVFIGMGSIILKGTTIGEGSVVGAGSVVSGVYPSGVVIAGNPAKIIKEKPDKK